MDDSTALYGRLSPTNSELSVSETYEDREEPGPSWAEIEAAILTDTAGAGLSDAAWEFSVLNEWFRERRVKREEGRPPQRTMEEGVEGAPAIPTAVERNFLQEQLNRLPLDRVQQRKHLAWCLRECRILAMPVPGWFTTAFGGGDGDESIIGDYHPSRSVVATPAARRRLEASTDLFEDEENEVEAEEEEVCEQEEHSAGIWEDGDESKTSPWLTVEEGLLIGADGALVAGFVPMPQVPEPHAGISSVGTADEFSAETAFAEVRALQGRAMALLDGDDASDNPSVVLAAIREARQCIALAARLAGILDGD